MKVSATADLVTGYKVIRTILDNTEVHYIEVRPEHILLSFKILPNHKLSQVQRFFRSVNLCGTAAADTKESPDHDTTTGLVSIKLIQSAIPTDIPGHINISLPDDISVLSAYCYLWLDLRDHDEQTDFDPVLMTDMPGYDEFDFDTYSQHPSWLVYLLLHNTVKFKHWLLDPIDLDMLAEFGLTEEWTNHLLRCVRKEKVTEPIMIELMETWFKQPTRKFAELFAERFPQ